jgi:hypothetical protein
MEQGADPSIPAAAFFSLSSSIRSSVALGGLDLILDKVLGLLALRRQDGGDGVELTLTQLAAL